MDAVTYSNTQVIAFTQRSLIPVRVSLESTSLFKQFHVQWTPTLVVTGSDGREYHRSVGFFDRDALIPELLLGMSKAFSGESQFQKALETVDALLEDFPHSNTFPEAIFQRGIYRYKITLDHKHFQEACNELETKYPASVWTKRARMLYRYPCSLSKWESCQEKRILVFESPQNKTAFVS